MTLAAVSTQQLLPSKRGGLIPAAELLMIGYGARQHIRRNALQHLIQEIAITRKNGSFSLDESLARLMREGHIDHELAVHYANHVDDLNCLLK
jgi:twitching motility protein PilT